MSQADVLWLAIADRSAASSRVRAFELSDALTLRGIDSSVVVASGIGGRIQGVAAVDPTGSEGRRSPEAALRSVDDVARPAARSHARLRMR